MKAVSKLCVQVIFHPQNLPHVWCFCEPSGSPLSASGHSPLVGTHRLRAVLQVTELLWAGGILISWEVGGPWWVRGGKGRGKKVRVWRKGQLWS